MIELTQARKKNGRYTSKKTFYKNRRVWFEVMCMANFAIWGVVASDLAPIAEAYYSIPDRIEIWNRESADQSSLRGTASDDTDETVTAVSDSEPRESEEAGTPAMDNSPSSVEAKILKAWEGTKEGRIAVAVAKSESGLRTDAMGWNCHYINAQGKQYSKACLPQDRAKAWSVDCGVMQINHIGKTCPAHLFDPDENIKIGKEKYDNSEKRIGIGFYPWMAYRNNLHLKFL